MGRQFFFSAVPALSAESAEMRDGDQTVLYRTFHKSIMLDNEDRTV